MVNDIEQLNDISIISEQGKVYRLTELLCIEKEYVSYKEIEGLYIVKLFRSTGSKRVDDDLLSTVRFFKDVEKPECISSIVDIIISPYIGYVIETSDEYTSLEEYLSSAFAEKASEWEKKGGELYGRILIGYLLAKAFEEIGRYDIHISNFSIRNVFIKTGRNPLIIMSDVGDFTIGGNAICHITSNESFLSPEVIEKKRNPDYFTDNYVLAVILSYVLELKSFKSGIANDGIVDSMQLKKLLDRCFSEGIKDRYKRPSPKEYLRGLIEASDRLFKCPICDKWLYEVEDNNESRICPHCKNVMKEQNQLVFYDLLFDGENYRDSVFRMDDRKEKRRKSVILKKGVSNRIKATYILRDGNFYEYERFSEDYFIISNDRLGWFILNEFSKTGILVRKHDSKRMWVIKQKEKRYLTDGDEIYFEQNDITKEKRQDYDETVIKCGGKRYSFIKLARFKEER